MYTRFFNNEKLVDNETGLFWQKIIGGFLKTVSYIFGYLRAKKFLKSFLIRIGVKKDIDFQYWDSAGAEVIELVICLAVFIIWFLALVMKKYTEL